MSDPSSSLKPWVQVIGTVTIVAALWAARDIAFPIVLAALLTFLLSPPVSWLERRIGRIPAVLGVVGISFAGLVIALMIVTWQLDGLVRELPRYRRTLVSKLAELRNAGRGGAVEELQKTFEDVKEELGGAATRDEGPSRPRPTVVLAERIESGQGLFPWLGSIVGLAAQVGVVVTLVIFMLLERRDLRDRIIGVIGRGHVALTTKALDEASSRVSRQLLMQGVVNVIYGATAALGLWYLGVPYAMLWAALGAALRFIPYLGPVLAAGAPILISAAASDGWKLPLQVTAFYGVLELFTNLVLETVLYAGAAGVSQVSLLLSVTFWTWLWGPPGLLVATPLTVVLVVLGKHVRGFESIATMMADTEALPASHGVYQRLLARDTDEAAELVERNTAIDAPRSVYDTLLLPTLTFAEADRLEGRLTAEEEQQVYASLEELIADVADHVRRVEAEAAEDEGEVVTPTLPGLSLREPLKVLGWAANGTPDEMALGMLARLVDDLPVEITVRSKLMATEMVEVTRAEGIEVVCLVDLPPGSPSRTRYLLKKLHEQAPELRILVGRWAPREYADSTSEPLIRAGASHVAQSMTDTRDVLQSMVVAAMELAAATSSHAHVDEEPVAPAP